MTNMCYLYCTMYVYAVHSVYSMYMYIHTVQSVCSYSLHYTPPDCRAGMVTSIAHSHSYTIRRSRSTSAATLASSPARRSFTNSRRGITSVCNFSLLRTALTNCILPSSSSSFSRQNTVLSPTPRVRRRGHDSRILASTGSDSEVRVPSCTDSACNALHNTMLGARVNRSMSDRPIRNNTARCPWFTVITRLITDTPDDDSPAH
eukprot:scpid91432/ scgid22516/ 